jgi:hypothetical protein
MVTKLCDGEVLLWESNLRPALIALRSRIHNVTKESPFYLLYGIHPRLPGDPDNPTIFDLSNEADVASFTNRELTRLGHARAAAYRRSQAQMDVMRRNQGEDQTVDELFEIGTYVKKINHRKTAFKYKFLGPFIITELLDNSLYRLMDIRGNVIQVPVHQDDLRIYSSQDCTSYYNGREVIHLQEDNNSNENEDQDNR